MVLCLLEVCRSLHHQIEAICPLPSHSPVSTAEVGPAEMWLIPSDVVSTATAMDYRAADFISQFRDLSVPYFLPNT